MRGLHICCNRERYLDIEDLALWAAERTEIDALEYDEIDVVETEDGLEIWDTVLHERIDIGDNTLVSFDQT